MKKSINLKLIAISMLLMAFSAHAQICAGGYDRDDRSIILHQYNGAGEFLTQLASIAELVANNYWSDSQRAQFDFRFQRIKNKLDQFGEKNRRGISVRSNEFLNNVIDVSYLGLSNSKVSGLTNEESQENARNTLDSVNQAISDTLVCLKNSWERHEIIGTENDGVCAGGFDLRDTRIVSRRNVGAIKILVDMARIAERAANDLYSRNQLIGLNADYQFLKEELDIYGSQNISRISPRTVNFLKTVIDPVFLGIINTNVVASTIAESQANARESLDALNAAIFVLNGCTTK